MPRLSSSKKGNTRRHGVMIISADSLVMLGGFIVASMTRHGVVNPTRREGSSSARDGGIRSRLRRVSVLIESGVVLVMVIAGAAVTSDGIVYTASWRSSKTTPVRGCA